MATMTLTDLAPGERARVVKVEPAGDTGRRVAEMGVTVGVVVEVERIAPLGDPIEVKVKGYHLGLRREEARRVVVERVQ